MGVRISLASPLPSIRPGDTLTCDVRVTNSGPEADRFSIRVVNDLAAWSWSTPSALALGPGSEGTARIACQPPRASTTVPGPRSLTIEVVPSKEPSQSVTASAAVEIESFPDVSAELDPVRAHGRRSSTHRVVVHNRGNAPLRAALRSAGSDENLQVHLDPAHLEVDAGGSGTAQVVATLPGRVSRASVAHPFQVRVEPEDGFAVQLDGALLQDGLLTGRGRLLGAGAVVLIAVVILAFTVFTSSSAGKPSPTRSAVVSCPGSGHLAHDANGKVRPNVIEPDNYAFLFLNNGCSPVRFDPCQPVHYAVDSANATPANLADLGQAITMLSRATGMTFVSDGITSDASTFAGIYMTAKAQGRWPPVGIDWKHLGPGTNYTETAGEGRPDVVDGVIVSGGITFNADVHLAQGTPVPNGFGPGVTWGRIMLHELGHVVGLGHVTNPNEIMHEPITDPSSAPTSAYGIGDLAGLRLVGRGAGCEAVPALRSLPHP
ncbi:MAG: hypothetical protein ACYC1D_16955 [Acidimicrobiales bacterium]